MYISPWDKSASMVSLIKLIKGIVLTALLSKTVRGTLTTALTKSLGRILRPSTILTVGAFIAALLKSDKSTDRPKNFQTLLENTLASMLLKTTKRSGITFTEAEAASTINAILSTLMRSIEGVPSVGYQDNKNRVIESNDYRVVYDK